MVWVIIVQDLWGIVWLLGIVVLVQILTMSLEKWSGIWSGKAPATVKGWLLCGAYPH